MRALLPAALLCACLGAAGCAITGGRITALRMEGSVVDGEGVPLPGARVHLQIREDRSVHGLMEIPVSPPVDAQAGLDCTVTADEEGRFRSGVATFLFPQFFWILPPLGTLFQGPPDPILVVRVEDAEEYYLVKVLRDGAEVQSLDLSTGRPLKRPPRYRVTGRAEEFDFPREDGKTLAGRRVFLRIRRSVE